VKRGPDLSWLKDWRVLALAGGCLIAGFLIGLLTFGAPWHLPPNWGDIPTWLLVIFGAIGGWAALNQLRILQQQFAGELQHSAKRDELLNRQLAEAQARAMYERRWQAEDIGVTRWQQRRVYVDNQSRRPISDITCQIVAKADLRTVAQPIKVTEVNASGGTIGFPCGRAQSSRYEKLRPERRCIFDFDESFTLGDEHIIVVWFTDDAGFRWQLDEYLHLTQSEDEGEYRP
jgi:hypothetical protein